MRTKHGATLVGIASLAAVLLGCSAPTHVSASATRTSTAAAATPTSTMSTASRLPAVANRPRKHRPQVTLIDAVDRTFVVVAAYASNRPELWVTDRRANVFHRLVFPAPRYSYVDDVDFLNRREGWFLVYNTGNERESLFRTRDHGSHWQRFPAPGHVEDSDTFDSIQFLNASTGYLTDYEGTGPQDALFRTRNGGRTWHVVRPRPRIADEHAGELPEQGVPVFSTALDGYLSSAPMGYPPVPALRTRDGGHRWVRTGASHSREVGFGPITTFGTRAIAASWRCGRRTELRARIQTIGSRHWSAGPALRVRRAGEACELSTSFSTLDAGWAVVSGGRRTTVARLIGSRWHAVAAPIFPGEPSVEVVGFGRRHAWLYARGTYIYVTSDGGRSWHRRVVRNRPK